MLWGQSQELMLKLEDIKLLEMPSRLCFHVCMFVQLSLSRTKKLCDIRRCNINQVKPTPFWKNTKITNKQMLCFRPSVTWMISFWKNYRTGFNKTWWKGGVQTGRHTIFTWKSLYRHKNGNEDLTEKSWCNISPPTCLVCSGGRDGGRVDGKCRLGLSSQNSLHVQTLKHPRAKGWILSQQACKHFVG